ncbi:lipopolysaccharide biosynthesis protein [Phocaeicola sartorii]|uniref:lipopolysaccharide biosynthesis protein n=1 Tax=Phocaeicola sartorii TaxID=671267 RepID=UPI001F56F602|nr:sugar transporter [Phocaeicola sartorii]
MSENNRTTQSIKNARVSLLFSILVLIFGFFSRKILIDSLGVEVLGLNTTATNLLGFLNLAELGISSAISYTLYIPLFQKNYETINEIVAIQGWLYRRIACTVFVGGVLLMCFLPWIFSKMDLPLWYAYGSFGVLLIAAILGYIFNYQQIVLSADQQEYKINYNVQGSRCMKLLMQIVGIGYFHQGYIYWLIVELSISVITCFFLSKTIHKSFPWLHPDISKGEILSRKYPEIIRKTKQLFFHKFSTYILGQTSPLIVYAFLSLTIVAVYGNYMLLIGSISMVVNSIFNGINASIGNLVAEGKREKILSFFREYTVIRYWLASMICFCLFSLSHSFISFWVGEAYLLDSSSFTLLVVYAFISMTRTNDPFISAYGLFQDIYAPAVEATLNLGLSVLLGYHYGLPGIIAGILISLLLIVCSWKPYFLYSCGFKIPISNYILMITNIISAIIITCLISLFILEYIDLSCSNIVDWFQTALKVICVYGIVSIVIFVILNKDYRALLQRLYKHIQIFKY